MKRILLGFLLLITIDAGRAALPDWIAASLAADLGSWAKEPAIQLLDSREIRYTAIDRVVEVRRGVVRAAASEGRESAHATCYYDPNTERVRTARAWVISAGGKKYKEYRRQDFTDTFTTYSEIEWDNRRVLIFDAGAKIEMGGALAWEIETESNSAIAGITHVFSAGLPVMQNVLDVVPPPGGVLQWHTLGLDDPSLSGGESARALHWMLSRIEPTPEAETEGFYRKRRMIMVRCEPSGGTGTDLSSWSNFSYAVAGIFAPKIEASAPILAKAVELVGPRTARWERIRSLCAFTQKEIRYLSISLEKDYLAGYRPHQASTILKNRYGDCKDKATLLAALMQAVGEKAHVLLLYSGDPTAVTADWPWLSFNHAIVAIPADEDTPESWPIIEAGDLGKLVVFDPTNAVVPLGVLAREDQGGYGLIVAPRGGGLTRLPLEDPVCIGTECRIHAAVNDRGELTADVETTLSGSWGSESFSRRLNLRADGFNRWLESSLHATFSIVNDFRSADSWDEEDSRHSLKYHFSALGFGRPLGADRLLIAPCILAPDYTLPPPTPNDEGRYFYSNRVQKEIRIEIPPGWTVEEVPEDWNGKCPTASCDITYRIEGHVLVYRSSYLLRGGFLDRTAYEMLRGFMRKVQDAMRRQVILRRTDQR
jgi:hypothetical protein